jgi:hypothetical protein
MINKIEKETCRFVMHEMEDGERGLFYKGVDGKKWTGLNVTDSALVYTTNDEISSKKAEDFVHEFLEERGMWYKLTSEIKTDKRVYTWTLTDIPDWEHDYDDHGFCSVHWKIKMFRDDGTYYWCYYCDQWESADGYPIFYRCSPDGEPDTVKRRPWFLPKRDLDNELTWQ